MGDGRWVRGGEGWGLGEVRVRGWSVVEVEVWESLRNAEKKWRSGKKILFCGSLIGRVCWYMMAGMGWFGMVAGLGWWLGCYDGAKERRR